MIRIKLTAEDRERLDVPEVIEYNEVRPRTRELTALERELGLSYFDLGTKMSAGDPLSIGILAWMAIRSIGVLVSFEDANLDALGIELERVEADPKDQPSGN